MNSLAASLARIVKLARAGALGADGGWFASGIELHLCMNCPIGHALDLAWSKACRARRDDCLRQYAARYCGEPIVSRRAARLAIDIQRYERGTWRHDRDRTEMPTSYTGTPRE
jgi:hypothetical protein